MKVYEGTSEVSDNTVIKDGLKLTLIEKGISSIKTEYTLTTKKIPIESITIGNAPANLQVGSRQTLTATVNPANTTMDKTVIWSTSDAALATVTDGQVTAVKAGTVKVAATSKADSSKKGEVSITITDPPTEPEPTE